MLDLSETRRAPTWLLAGLILALYPWSWLVNQWFAANHHYRPLMHATHGVLYPNLQVCVPTLIFWLAVFRVAGLRLADVGWRARDLPRAALATFAVWIGCHLVALAIFQDVLELDPVLTATPGTAVGRTLGQFLGTALTEETIYRGFCLTQLLLLFRARGLPPTRAAGLAALASAVVFAVPHVPNRIYLGTYSGSLDVLGDQAMLLCSGLFLAWVYMRTRNLWWGVGMHALANEPALLIAWPTANADGEKKAMVGAFGLIATIAWPWLFRRSARGS